MLEKLRYQLKHGKLLRNFLGVGGMYMLAIPVGLATNILLARQLGPEEFGRYVFVLSVLTLLALPAAAGIPQLLTREIARFFHAKQWSLYRGIVRAAHAWVIILSVLIVAAFFLAKALGLIPSESKWALLGIVIVLVPLQGLNAVRNGITKGLGFTALAEFPLQTVQPILLLFGIALLAFIGTLSASLALWVQVVVTAVTFLFAVLLFLRVQPEVVRTYKPEYRSGLWLRALLPLTLISLVGTFNAQIGILLLGILGTDEDVGVLRIADRAAQFVCLSLMLVNMVIAPHIVKAWKENDRQHLRSISLQSARAAFLIAVIVALIFLFFGRVIISVTFGAVYSETSYIPMVILILGQLINVAVGSVDIFLIMSGHENLTLKGQIFGLLITGISTLILIPLYGGIGAAIGVSLGLVAWNAVMAFSVKKHLKLTPGIL